MEYGDKRKAVLQVLQDKPMSVYDLHEHFRPAITYAYLRTMLYKLHATGEVEVCGTGQLTISSNGGHREYFIYRRVGSDAQLGEQPVRSKTVFKVGHRYPKKLGNKPKGSRGRPHKKLLTDKEMTVDERRSLILEVMPLFQMYA
jgi:hypothetical protein